MQVALNGSILDRVIYAIKQTTYTRDQKVTSETRLTCDLALGSFDRLKLAMYLEETFDVEISDDILKRAVTVADITKYISGHYFQDVDPLQLAEADSPVSVWLSDRGIM